MTYAYKEFLVHDPQLQRSIPSTTGITKIRLEPFRATWLVAPVSVARVRPRTSKGITDLLLPQTSLRLKRKVPLRRSTSLYLVSCDYLAG